MEKNIETILIKIPIIDIINEVLKNSPNSECQFNNLIGYSAMNLFLEHLNTKLNTITQNGGKKNKTRSNRTKINLRKAKSKRTKTNSKRAKKTRKIRQSGGADPRIVIVFMSLLVMLVQGIKNMTHYDVVQRLKDTFRVSDLFRNDYGTCTVNSMLFLKAIDLKTFGDLSIQVMSSKEGLTTKQMTTYLNSELDIYSKWFKFNIPEGFDEENAITQYINIVKDKLINIRGIYGFSDSQDLLTVMNYPVKGKSTGHSVVLWLTNRNEIIIIDPQRYYYNNQIILYTSEFYMDPYMNNDKELHLESIRTYIREKIDIMSDWRTTDIFESMHIEVVDTQGDNRLSQTNKKLIETISRIQSARENLQDRIQDRMQYKMQDRRRIKF